jgi:hypothetical protein
MILLRMRQTKPGRIVSIVVGVDILINRFVTEGEGNGNLLRLLF